MAMTHTHAKNIVVGLAVQADTIDFIKFFTDVNWFYLSGTSLPRLSWKRGR